MNLTNLSVFLMASVACFGACADSAFAQQTPAPAANPTPNSGQGQGQPLPDPPQPSRRLLFGPEVGVYFPSNGKVRDAFGNNFVNYGIGLGSVPQTRDKGYFTFDLNLFSARRSGSSFLLVPVGVAYRKGLTNRDTGVRPYVGASVNLIVADLRSDKYKVDSGVRATGGGSVFTGLNFSDRAYLQARYYGIATISGFELSGLNVSTGFRF
jgi:hypothetical protein